MCLEPQISKFRKYDILRWALNPFQNIAMINFKIIQNTEIDTSYELRKFSFHLLSMCVLDKNIWCFKTKGAFISFSNDWAGTVGDATIIRDYSKISKGLVLSLIGMTIFIHLVLLGKGEDTKFGDLRPFHIHMIIELTLKYSTQH